MEYTTNQKGLITEMEVMLYLVKLGYNVSKPLNADSRYDCILDINGNLLKIQIKTSHWKNDEHTAFKLNTKSVTTSGGCNVTTVYNKKEIDYFATYIDGQVYLIPVEECSAEKTIWTGMPANNQVKNISFATKYIASEVLKNL